MSSPRALRVALVISLAAVAGAPPALAIDVFLRGVRASQPVFGTVTIEAEVLASAPVESLVFRVDGEVSARLSEPPWRISVDVGQENRAHTFEVTVTDAEGASAAARVTTPPITVDDQVDLELRQLYVTVTRRGERVLDLPRSAFSVTDEGEPQELVTFEGGDVPLTAAILVDASLSMAGPRLDAAVSGAEAFVADMQPLDEASLMLFSDRLLHRTPFTGDPEVVGQALQAVEARGGTALNDFLYAALSLLDRRQGRRVVILLSDGVDIESVLAMEDVLWKAERSQALVYWIRLRDADAPPVLARLSAWRDGDAHRREREELTELVTGTGGRIVDLASIEDAPSAFRDILAELRDQYVLGYYPSLDLDDGRWHRVRVEVDEFAVKVRAREGYVDD